MASASLCAPFSVLIKGNQLVIAQEAYIINLMDSMLPSAGTDPSQQEKARAMIQALLFSLVYKCRSEGTVMS